MLKLFSKNKQPVFLGFIFLFVLIFCFNVPLVLADETGYTPNPESGGSDSVAWDGNPTDFQDDTGLGNKDPRIIVTNLINIALGFLGLLAIVIIIYAGFLWMMSGGNPDKIAKAKRVLISGFIGLIIIISSFAIASFVLDLLFRSSTVGGGGVGGGGLVVGGSSCMEDHCSGFTGAALVACMDLNCSGSGGPGSGDWALPCSNVDGSCSADDTLCPPGPNWSCNSVTCLCEVINSDSCYNPYDNICNYPCSAGLACYGAGGCEDNLAIGGCPPGDTTCHCCCDPNVLPENDTCKLMHATLECWDNVAPCNDPSRPADDHTPGASRGLCCGCEADNECGSVNVRGCGNDECCHARPDLLATIPDDGDVDICTNPLVSIEFTQPMSQGSLANNILLIGEYQISAHPSGCPEDTNLVDINEFPVPDAGGANYCSVAGSTKVRNEGGQYYVDFIPSHFLSIDTDYHIVILGGQLSADGNNIDGGVQNFWKISKEDDDYRTFTTINDPSETKGVCMIEKVSLLPTSYLFKTSQNSVREDDTDARLDSFDIDADRDKLFVARALSDTHQTIVSMDGYRWDWVMESSVTADVTLDETILGLSAGSALAEAAESVKDGRSVISASIDMDAYSNTTYIGNHLSASSMVYIFICNNPWPPVKADGTWDPWQPVNSSGVIENDFNYDIYYCRDIDPDGTVDDLPAFDRSGVIGDSASPANPDNLEVLEVVHFAYETPPAPANMIETCSIDGAICPAVEAPGDKGGMVFLSWGAASSFSEEVTGYNVYWSERSGVVQNYQDVGNVNEITISELTNGVPYYFSVSAYTADNAESSRYPEMMAIPYDVVATTTTTFLVVTDVRETEVELSWDKAGGAYAYQVSYGVGDATTGKEMDAENRTGIEIRDLSPGTRYSFVVRIVDEAGNIGSDSDTRATTTLPSL